MWHYAIMVRRCQFDLLSWQNICPWPHLLVLCEQVASVLFHFSLTLASVCQTLYPLHQYQNSMCTSLYMFLPNSLKIWLKKSSSLCYFKFRNIFSYLGLGITGLSDINCKGNQGEVNYIQMKDDKPSVLMNHNTILKKLNHFFNVELRNIRSKRLYAEVLLIYIRSSGL